MTNEIIERLTKAGFPETGFCGHCGYPDDTKGPTLSELIGAVGNDFLSLELIDGLWWADAWDKEMRKRLAQVSGSTPEEAVANVYLALKEATPAT